MSRTHGHRGCPKRCTVCWDGNKEWLQYRARRPWDVEDFDKDDPIEPEEMWWLWEAEYWPEDWEREAPWNWVQLAPVRWTLRERLGR